MAAVSLASLVSLVSLVSLDADVDVLLLALEAALAAAVELADETVLLSLLSVVPVDAKLFCCPAAWKSAPRNC